MDNMLSHCCNGGGTLLHILSQKKASYPYPERPEDEASRIHAI